VFSLLDCKDVSTSAGQEREGGKGKEREGGAVFTQIQGDTPPPQQKKTSAKEKCIYPNLIQPPKTETSAKKKYFTINFIHKACQILSAFTNQGFQYESLLKLLGISQVRG
jgi:hypothetical protein